MHVAKDIDILISGDYMREKHIRYYIDDIYQGKSIRSFLEDFNVSKKKIYKLEMNKAVSVNTEIKSFDHILKPYDVVEIDETFIAPEAVKKVKGDIDIVYEDEDIMILNKPSGQLVYTDGIDFDTLTNRIAYHFDNIYPILPVHRIDYETSGLVVFSKHPICQSYMSNLFELNHIKKVYSCLVDNEVKEKSGVIDKPIARDRHDNKMRVSSQGKHAKTSFETIYSKNGISKLKVEISGGRKHQIRVHLRSIGHPIVSDRLYGHMNDKYPRLMLHFESISFMHPRTHQLLNVTKPAAF